MPTRFPRISHESPVTTEQQAIWLNAVPLLALGVVYLAAGASLVACLPRRAPQHGAGPRAGSGSRLPLWRCRGDRLRAARAPRPRANRRLRLAGVRRDPASRSSLRSSCSRGSASARCCSPGRASHAPQAACATPTTIAEASHEIVERAASIARTELAALMLIDAAGAEAHGVVAIDHGEDVSWFPDVRLDLANEPSGVASAYHDAAAFAVYDAQASAASEHAARRGHRSAERRVRPADRRPARDRRARRRGDDQAARVLRRRPGRAPGARGGSRSRDRAVAEARTAIASRSSRSSPLGSGPTPTSTRCSSMRSPSWRKRCVRERCFVRLGEPDGAMTVKAQWHAEGLEPIGDLSLARLAVSNLAMRDRSTVALSDVATAPELADAAHGGRQGLLELGSRSVLATPIIVFDRLIGVLAVHRNVPGAWPAADVAFLEAVARELGLGLDTARLLADHERRLLAADRSSARGADADQRARVPGSPRGARQRGRAAARRGCRGLLALRRAPAHARVSRRARPARERDGERDLPRRDARRSDRGAATGSEARLRANGAAAPVVELPRVRRRDGCADHGLRRGARRARCVLADRGELRRAGARAARGVRGARVAGAAQRRGVRGELAPGADPARLLSHRLRARRAALALRDAGRRRAGGRRGVRRRVHRRRDAERRDPSPRGRPRAPRAAGGCARGRARRRVRFPARLGGASHPRVLSARDGRPLRRPVALARGAVRVSLAAAHPARGRGRGRGGARARLLRRRALAARRGHRARAPPRRCCTRRARAERLVRRGTHVARARAAARANGQRARNRARSCGGARRGRPAGSRAAGGRRVRDQDRRRRRAAGHRRRRQRRGGRARSSQRDGGVALGRGRAVAQGRRGAGCLVRRGAARLRRRARRRLQRVPRRPARRARELPPRRDRRVRARPAALAAGRDRGAARARGEHRGRALERGALPARRAREGAQHGHPREHRGRDRRARSRRERRALEPGGGAGDRRPSRGGARPFAAAGPRADA